jgi:hypothetical protein
VIELFAFREMNADATRFQILDFEGTLPYTPDGVTRVDVHGESAEASARPPSERRTSGAGLLDAVRRNSRRSNTTVPPSMAVQKQRFDVRRATCVGKGDKDALLAAIESCGAGFETFNDWMHSMLVVHCSPPEAVGTMTYVSSARHLADLASSRRSSILNLNSSSRGNKKNSSAVAPNAVPSADVVTPFHASEMSGSTMVTAAASAASRVGQSGGLPASL